MFVGYKRFTLTASTGDQTVTGIVDSDGNNIDFTGTGEPFVMLWFGRDNDDWSNSMGIATGTSGSETYSVLSHTPDGSGGIQNSSYQNSGDFEYRYQSTGSEDPPTVGMTWTLKTWGDGQITFNKTTAATAITVLMVCGIAANAQAVLYDMPTSTGDDDDAQLSWTPSSNAIMFGAFGSFINDPDFRKNASGGYLNFGVASEDAQWAHAVKVQAGTVSRIGTHINTDSDCIYHIEANGTVYAQASFVSWQTNGFRHNFSTASGSVIKRPTLVIDDGSGGDQCRAALWTTSASTGSESFDSGDATGLTPQAVLFYGDGEAADYSTTENGAYACRGVGNGQGQDSYRLAFQDGSGSGAVCWQDFDSTSCFTIVNDSNTVIDDIDFDALAEDGFDVTHDTNGGAKFVGVALMGLSSGGGGGGGPEHIWKRRTNSVRPWDALSLLAKW